MSTLTSFKSRMDAFCLLLETKSKAIEETADAFDAAAAKVFSSKISEIQAMLNPVHEASDLILRTGLICASSTDKERSELIRSTEAITATAIRALYRVKSKTSNWMIPTAPKELKQAYDAASTLIIRTSESSSIIASHLASYTPPSTGYGGSSSSAAAGPSAATRPATIELSTPYETPADISRGPLAGIFDFLVSGTTEAAVACKAEEQRAPSDGYFELRGDFSDGSWDRGIALESEGGFSNAFQKALAHAVATGKASFEFKLVHVSRDGSVRWATEASIGDKNLSSSVAHQAMKLSFRFE